MFESMTSTRLRSVFGRSCRNTDVQTWVSVSQFQKRVAALSFGLTVLTSVAIVSSQLSGRSVRLQPDLHGPPEGGHYGLHLQERFRIDPLAEFELEFPALVHEDLGVFRQHHAHALERPRRRAFEVNSRSTETAPVARALELGLGHQ